jgi:alkylation response protein AidB-like acyl-CoA dehydrogenase
MLDSTLKKISALIPYFSENARISDRENFFPIENFELIKKEGLLNLIVPCSFGGLGLNFLEYQLCIAEISKGCASTAASLNMHCIVLGALSDIFSSKISSEQREFFIPHAQKIFDKVVKEKKVFASATSEPRSGARYSKTKTTYEIVSGGYIINGIKFFVSMAEYADYYSIIANKKLNSPNEISSPHELTFFIVPKGTSGIKIVKDWDVVGMRGTQSHKIVFEDVFIPEESAFLGITGFALMKIIQAPHWVTGGYLGVYLGIMESALNFAVDYINERTDKSNQTGLGYDPIIQVGLSKLNSLYQLARYSVLHAANMVIENFSKKETHEALYLAKHVVGDNAIQLTTGAIKLCGGSTIHKKYNLERYMRDSICATLMPLASSACELYIGKSLLGLNVEDIW